MTESGFVNNLELTDSISNLNQTKTIINEPIKDDLYSYSKVKTVYIENDKFSSIKKILNWLKINVKIVIMLSLEE